MGLHEEQFEPMGLVRLGSQVTHGLTSGKNKPALAGTEYRMVPSQYRLVKRENRLVGLLQENRLVT